MYHCRIIERNAERILKLKAFIAREKIGRSVKRIKERIVRMLSTGYQKLESLWKKKPRDLFNDEYKLTVYHYKAGKPFQLPSLQITRPFQTAQICFYLQIPFIVPSIL